MNETWIQIGIVSLVALVAITGIVRMKSPSKGGDSMSSIINEIQKVIEPQAKEIQEVRKVVKAGIKKKKADDKEIT